MKFNSIFRKRNVWTIALYKVKNQDDIVRLDEHKPIHFFGEVDVRRDKNYQSTCADPFLYAHEGRLYLFYEIQTDFGVGEIWAQSMDAQGAWTIHGQVLKEDFHLSYPQVFIHGGQVWMVPEAANSGNVWLYAADVFPYKWRRVKILINEALLDPSIVIKPEGIYIFGTTRSYELKLFFSPDLSQNFVPTGHMLSKDKSISRNGGKPIFLQNVLHRVAQNCAHSYGQNISLLKIDHLAFNNYSEHMVVADLFQKKPKWMEAGYHHISTTFFESEHYVAVDGMRWDSYVNTLILAFLKILG